MIYLIHGDNDFLKHEYLADLRLKLNSELVVVEGESMTKNRLLDLTIGQSLFTDSQSFLVRDLSESEVWAELGELLGGADPNLILFEGKVDKRTRTYKWLAKNATVKEFKAYEERDRTAVKRWLIERAKLTYNIELRSAQADSLVDRLGLDQMRLDRVLEQLSLVGKVDQESVDQLVPLPRAESVFELFEAALKGDARRVQQIIRYLEDESGADGAYLTLGLIVSQLVPLNALALGGRADETARDLSVHPYVVKKLAAIADRLNARALNYINDSLYEADLTMKSSGASPWLSLEVALVRISHLNTGQ